MGAGRENKNPPASTGGCSLLWQCHSSLVKNVARCSCVIATSFHYSSKPYPPLYPPPRRLVASQLHPGLQRPARQRSPDTHSEAALRRHAGCGVSESDDGDYDFGDANSCTRPTTPCALRRSRVASTMSST